MRSGAVLFLLLVAGCSKSSGEPAPFEDGLYLTYASQCVDFESAEGEREVTFAKKGEDSFELTFDGKTVTCDLAGRNEEGRLVGIFVMDLRVPIWLPTDLRKKGGSILKNPDRLLNILITGEEEWKGSSVWVADFKRKTPIMTNNWRLKLLYEKETGFLVEVHFVTHLGEGVDLKLVETNAAGLSDLLSD